MRFTVLLYEENSERLFGAVVPELPGCVSQGETLDEALVNIRAAIEGHLLAMAAHGEDLPEQAGLPVIATVEVGLDLVAAANG